jgi:hypothetical protein
LIQDDKESLAWIEKILV